MKIKYVISILLFIIINTFIFPKEDSHNLGINSEITGSYVYWTGQVYGQIGLKYLYTKKRSGNISFCLEYDFAVSSYYYNYNMMGGSGHRLGISFLNSIGFRIHYNFKKVIFFISPIGFTFKFNLLLYQYKYSFGGPGLYSTTIDTTPTPFFDFPLSTKVGVSFIINDNSSFELYGKINLNFVSIISRYYNNNWYFNFDFIDTYSGGGVFTSGIGISYMRRL